MLRRLLALLFAAAVVFSFAPDASAQVAFPATATVNTAANLRAGPSTDNPIVGKAQTGQEIVLVASNAAGTWYRLDQGAWIAARLVAITGSAAGNSAAPESAVPLGAQEATVIDITDGDTISILVNGVAEKLRYIGIDTPERGQPGYKAATEANRQLVGGKTVYLVRDRSDRDRYDRLLRYAYLADGTFVNGQLVAQGMAQPVAYDPDTAQRAELERLAVAAAKAERGFWSGASPYDGAMSYAITTAAAQVYVAAGTGNAVNARLAADTPLTVFGRTQDGGWFQVRTPARDGGWIAASAVKVNVPLAQIPVTGNAATAPAMQPAAGPATGTGTVAGQANLRTGPGANYAIAGSAAPGMMVTVIGRSADGAWLQLASGAWIAAFLVRGVAGDVPVVGAPAQRVTGVVAEQLPPAAPSSQGALAVVGLDKRQEYADIRNIGSSPVDLTGWVLRSERGSQDCALSGVIQPGATLRIWAMGGGPGFNCGFGTNIWNNSEHDPAVLLAPGGAEVSRYH
jgi:endonuclease YncB( thermonuclease family)